MMRFLIALLCCSFTSVNVAASEEAASPVLIELFASQNCPACPKAHRTMQEMAAENPSNLILTWSVNYWDYLGDPDPMALAEAKTRQAAYTELLGLRAPYTPQSIYNGTKECPGTRKRDVRRNIQTLQKQNQQPLDISYQQGELSLAENNSLQPLQILLVEYLDATDHTTDMVNPVTAISKLTDWSGAPRILPITCTHACAVLFQEAETGQIIRFERLHGDQT